MDYDIARAKELIAQREAIDVELKQLFGSVERSTNRKPQSCSNCGEAGHSSRTCPTKQAEQPA